MYFIQPCFICRPSCSTVSEDAGMETRASFVQFYEHEDCNLLEKAETHKMFLNQSKYMFFHSQLGDRGSELDEPGD